MRQLLLVIFLFVLSIGDGQSIIFEKKFMLDLEDEISLTIPRSKENRCYAVLKFLKQIRLEYRLNSMDKWESINIDEHAEDENYNFALLFFNENDENILLRKSEHDNSLEAIFIELTFKNSTISENRKNEEIINRNCTCIPLIYKNRVQWNCPTGEPAAFVPTLSPLTHIVIHHQAGFANPPYENTVNAIYDYHVNTLGWSDIGYNWLIAPNGELFKGRAWIDETNQNVLGAHTCSCNANKLGVCLLGNYTSELPSYAQFNALQNFMVWKACELDIELPIASNINSRKSGSCIGEIMPKITGHKDNCGVGYTACPGDKFYPQLEKLRKETIEKYLSCLETLNTSTNNITETGIKIYPNPNVGDFTLFNSEEKEYFIEIIDLFWKTIYKSKVEDHRLSVNLDLTRGLYLVKTIDLKGRQIVQKMIIEK